MPDFRDEKIDRTGWPAGPWDVEPDVVDWTDPVTGYRCVIRRNRMGALCGYVEVPKGHPFHGAHYSANDPKIRSLKERIRVAYQALRGNYTDREPYEHTLESLLVVHGGITYAGERLDDGTWFVGFDCSHAWDVSPGLGLDLDIPDSIYRNIPYVMGECTDLAKQIWDYR